MKEHGIIFNTEMVRAILDGRKTQTRRIVKHQRHPSQEIKLCDDGFFHWSMIGAEKPLSPINYEYGRVGDRLWVRETFQVGLCTKSSFAYKATHKPSDLDEGWDEVIKWRPSTQMPRWASRITLEITDVRVERLQDISKQDAVSEGAPPGHHSIDVISKRFGFPDFSRSWFAQIWMDIYGEDNWAANPWVWVIEFKRV
nr:hypothetical protein [Providencia stuartii]